jgi:cytochrome c553
VLVSPTFNPFMKPHRSLHAVLTLSGLCWGAFAATEPAVNARFVEPKTPQETERLAIGERTINRLTMTLVREVAGAGTPEGAEKALDVCHLKALPATGVIIKDEPRIVGFKRTSQKLRSPANAPDTAEQLVLNRIQKNLEDGVAPKTLLQQIDLPDGKSEWRVYKAVAVLPQCAACHGPSENLSPEMQARLKERYPDDKANRYAPGNWRGIVRVTVADPPPTPPPAAKAAPSTSKKK